MVNLTHRISQNLATMHSSSPGEVVRTAWALSRYQLTHSHGHRHICIHNDSIQKSGHTPTSILIIAHLHLMLLSLLQISSLPMYLEEVDPKRMTKYKTAFKFKKEDSISFSVESKHSNLAGS